LFHCNSSDAAEAAGFPALYRQLAADGFPWNVDNRAYHTNGRFPTAKRRNGEEGGGARNLTDLTCLTRFFRVAAGSEPACDAVRCAKAFLPARSPKMRRYLSWNRVRFRLRYERRNKQPSGSALRALAGSSRARCALEKSSEDLAFDVFAFRSIPQGLRARMPKENNLDCLLSAAADDVPPSDFVCRQRSRAEGSVFSESLIRVVIPSPGITLSYPGGCPEILQTRARAP